MMRQLFLSGSYFENGHEIGRFGKPQIKDLIRHDRKLLDLAKRRQKTVVKTVFNLLKKDYWNFLEELRGMSEGAKADFWDLFLENCPEILKKSDGCTSGAINGPRHRFIIHNEDEDRWRSAKGCALAHYQQKKFEYSSFIYFGELAGNAFNWNNRGLFFCVDYAPPVKINPRGAPRYFEARRLLESRNLKEALDFLRKSKSASGFHYLIGDTVSKRIVSVEKYLDRASILEVKSGESFCHSNHYIHPVRSPTRLRIGTPLSGITSNGVHPKDGSLLRLKIAQENLTNQTSPKEALKIWTTLLRQPLHKNSETETFATVLANLHTGKILIYRSMDKK